MKKLYIFCLAACSLTACKPNLDPETPDRGQLNFERYLAVGNSLTAGVMDGSLTVTGQKYAYPAMMAEQFALVGGGEFKTPFLPGDNGFPTPKMVLAVRQGPCDTVASIKPVSYPGALDSFGSASSVALGGPYHNTGIPLIRTIDYLTPGYATQNPFARRFFSNLLARPIDEVMRANPTFFSVWIGANDVLSYATGGGKESATPISDIAQFQAAYDSVLTILTAKGAKGVAMNIPDITALPFFNAIPAKGVTLTRRQADDLNAAYNGTFVRFDEGANYPVIQDGTDVRLLRQGEMLLLSLPLDSVKCAGWGTKKPIPGNFVITLEEAANIRSAVTQFNNIIANVTRQKNIALADMNAYFATVQSGIAFNGIHYSTTYVSGGLFSLDGIHPSARGYALVANKILSTINAYYGSNVSMVDANKYPGVQYP